MVGVLIGQPTSICPGFPFNVVYIIDLSVFDDDIRNGISTIFIDHLLSRGKFVKITGPMKMVAHVKTVNTTYSSILYMVKLTDSLMYSCVPLIRMGLYLHSLILRWHVKVKFLLSRLLKVRFSLNTKAITTEDMRHE